MSSFTNTTITVTWSDALGDKEGYFIFCENSRGDTDVKPEKDEQRPNKTATNATCTGLTPGTAYNVTIETLKEGFDMEECYEECLQRTVTGK